MAFFALLAPVWTTISACFGIMISIISISKFGLNQNRKFFWSKGLLFFSSVTYVVYFLLLDQFSENSDFGYIVSSNLPFVLFGLVCFIRPSQSIQGLSKFIAAGMILIFLIYLTLKIGCDLGLFSESLSTNLFHGQCYRIRFGSRNALMTGAMIATLVGMIYVDLDLKSKSTFAVSSIAIGLSLYLIIFGIQSRGATITVLFLMLVGTVWFANQASTKQSLMHLAASIMVVIVISSLPYLNKQKANALDRINIATQMIVTETDEGDGSVQSRFDMYKAGIAAFKEKPIFGYGYPNRFDVAIPYLPEEFKSRHHHLHNAIINHLVAGGIFGLLVYVGLFSQGLFVLIQSKLALTKRNVLFFQIYSSFFLIGVTTETMGHFVNTTFFGLVLALATLYSDDFKNNQDLDKF